MPATPHVLRTTQSAAAEKREQLSLFGRLANTVAHWSGRPGTFLLCCLIIVVWAVTGPIFHYSDTWQLIINTGTTIVTFLMVFLIQNTQNRDGAALQAKLDELIRVTETARNDLVGVERLPESKLEEIREEVAEEANHASPAQPTNVRP
jgi:low affinity Fe/Cu permease